jgi:multidrug efflux pump subunit AcrA (membrane-fusion protein)
MRNCFAWFIPVCLVLACGCSKKEEEAESETPAPVQVAAVAQESIQRVVRGDGVLFPRDQWNVMPKVSAPVQRFLANRGDHVRQGQLLAVLENRDLVAAVAANKGQVAQAQANLRSTENVAVPESIVKAKSDVQSLQTANDAARKVLESRQKLYQEGALSRKLVDDATVAYAQASSELATAQEHLRTLQSAGAQAQIEGARAQVEAAQAQFQSAEAQVAYSEVRSPGTGIVADRPLYAGDVATTGAPLMVIVDVSRLVARVNVPVNEASGVKVGQTATVALAGGGGEIPGTVTVVSPAADPNAATVQIWIEIANPKEQLKPGATVHVSIVTGTLNGALLVPAAAILPGEAGGASVLVVTQDSVAHKRAVQVGVRQDERVQIVKGVSAGEKVVTVGGVGVDDNGKVRIVAANAASDEEEHEDQPAAKGARGGESEGKSSHK